MHFVRQIKTTNTTDEIFARPLEVVVTSSFEEAYRRFKILVQNEGVVANYKARQTYEKPSEKKRRKRREAQERRVLLATREALILSGEWDKRQKRKEQKRQEKLAAKRSRQSLE